MSSQDAGLILMSDSRVAAIPVHDNGEPLINLLTDQRFRIDESRKHINSLTTDFSSLRLGVVTRLLAAQEQLPAEITFLIREGHRTLSVQQTLFDRYSAILRKRHPDCSEEELLAEVSRFVAPPSIAPHSTGGALDLTLVYRDTGLELEMGSDFNAEPSKAAGATYTAAVNITPVAKEHREILCNTMQSAGFVNYPSEWWHWSYGDRYWALVSKQPFAVYGGI